MKRKRDADLVKTVRPDGTVKWRNKEGKLHREDGPACEYPSGAKEWYRDGKLHRDDGPAKEYPTQQRWYRNGHLHRDDGPAIVDADGTREWYRNGRQHRDDGPAVEHPDGFKAWYRRGKLHRDDGPACEAPDGRFWFRNGKRHREDGPAFELADGRTKWYIDGVELTAEQVAAFKEKQFDAIGEAIRKGLDHSIKVKPPLKLKSSSGTRKSEADTGRSK
jgi:hypothetical protein